MHVAPLLAGDMIILKMSMSFCKVDPSGHTPSATPGSTAELLDAFLSSESKAQPMIY